MIYILWDGNSEGSEDRKIKGVFEGPAGLDVERAEVFFWKSSPEGVKASQTQWIMAAHHRKDLWALYERLVADGIPVPEFEAVFNSPVRTFFGEFRVLFSAWAEKHYGLRAVEFEEC